MYKVVFLLIFTTLVLTGRSQELFCNVEVSSQQIQGTDKRVYESMRNAIYEFMNNQIWTNYTLKYNEKIECSILINVTERPSNDYFLCDMTLALRRPVYNSSYNSVLFNFIDKDIEIDYIENQPLDFSVGTFSSNLTSILGFYAYMMIGLDFDSFIPDGGDPFYESASLIVNTAQSSNYTGWKSAEGTKNRFWLLENLTNPSYAGIRSYLYEYHRLGLDVMYEKPEEGRAVILKTLEYLQKVKQSRPGLLILQIISDSKRDEYVNVFSDGTPTEKSNAVKFLNEIDPSNAMTYQKIIQK
jgi:hypothetical protein